MGRYSSRGVFGDFNGIPGTDQAVMPTLFSLDITRSRKLTAVGSWYQRSDAMTDLVLYNKTSYEGGGSRSWKRPVESLSSTAVEAWAVPQAHHGVFQHSDE